MTFNIFEGGDSLLRNRTYRLDLIARIVRNANPDVVALQECTGWDDDGQKTLHEFEQQVGMLALLAVTEGFPVGLLVKPEFGIVFADALTQGFWHGMLDVTVADADNQTTRFLNVHLHPSDPRVKSREIRKVLDRYDKGDRTIILGDMNSLSHLDNLKLSDLSDETQSRHVVKGEFDFSVSRSLEDAGFVDAYAAIHEGNPAPTIPTAAARVSKFTPARLDYIYVSPDLRDSLASIEVFQTEDSEFASDHYPIVMEMSDVSMNGQS
jgi:exodeoxyribonuclease-3